MYYVIYKVFIKIAISPVIVQPCLERKCCHVSIRGVQSGEV